MKVCLFGLGSAGKRHLALLNKLYKFDIYAFRSGNSIEYSINQFWDWDTFDVVKPDVCFITNPTNLHIETAIKCIEHNVKYIFLEKPVDCTTDKLDDLLRLVDKHNVTAYVAYPFRHHPVINHLKKPYHKKWVYFACHTDFRKWRPYKTYSHDPKQGGAILELSHELDTAKYLLGDIKNIDGTVNYSKKFGFDTQCFLRVEHCRGNVSFHNLNIVNAHETRFIKFRHKERINIVSLDEMYERQINYFFANLDNPQLENNIFEAAETFKKIMEFKNCAH